MSLMDPLCFYRLSRLEEGVATPLTGPFLTSRQAREDRPSGLRRGREGEKASLQAVSFLML